MYYNTYDTYFYKKNGLQINYFSKASLNESKTSLQVMKKGSSVLSILKDELYKKSKILFKTENISLYWTFSIIEQKGIFK